MTGQVHFPTQSRVIHLMGIRAHQPHNRKAGVDAGAQREQRQQRHKGTPVRRLDRVGHFRKAAHIGEQNGDFPATPGQIELLRCEEFLNHLGAHQFGKHVLHAALFPLLEVKLVRDEADVIHQQGSEYRRHHGQPKSRLEIEAQRHAAIGDRDPSDRDRGPGGPQVPGQKSRDGAQHQDEQAFDCERRGAHESSGHHRMRHVPVLAEEV